MITIGTVKTLKHVYGIDILLQALSILYQKLKLEHVDVCDQLQFRIVGGGPDLESLKALAVELKIDHVTIFVGAVAHDDVPNELSKLDIYVALSRQESFGVAVIEAQAMGRPLITTRLTSLPEVAGSGAHYVDDPLDVEELRLAINKIIVEEVYRNNLIDEGYKNVSRFTWPVMRETYYHVYKNILST